MTLGEGNPGFALVLGVGVPTVSAENAWHHPVAGVHSWHPWPTSVAAGDTGVLWLAHSLGPSLQAALPTPLLLMKTLRSLPGPICPAMPDMAGNTVQFCGFTKRHQARWKQEKLRLTPVLYPPAYPTHKYSEFVGLAMEFQDQLSPSKTKGRSKVLVLSQTLSAYPLGLLTAWGPHDREGNIQIFFSWFPLNSLLHHLLSTSPWPWRSEVFFGGLLLLCTT